MNYNIMIYSSVFKMTHYIVIDTETTGLPDYTKKDNPWPKPISIGAVHCSLIKDDMHIYSENEWYIEEWMNEIDDNTLKFLNLNRDVIKSKSVSINVFIKWLQETLNTFNTFVFVAHNSDFDKNVLKYAGIDIVDDYPWFCTMKCNSKLFNKYPKLSELATYYNIYMNDKLAHTALYDAQICTRVLYGVLTSNRHTMICTKRDLELRNRTIEYYTT